MTLQLVLLAALVLGVLPILASVGGRRRLPLVLLYLALVAGAAVLWTARSWPPPPEEHEISKRPIEVDRFGYVNSDTCRSCHPAEHASWQSSYHRTMTQAITPETVAAPFAGEVVAGHRGPYRYWREDGRLMVELPDPSWQGPGPAPRARGEVVVATGSHHLQLYWFAAGNGRTLGMTGMIWNVEEQEWLPMPSNFLRPEIDASRATDGFYGLWNVGCANCHSTNPRGRARPDGTLDTDLAEFGIACEACHGPAGAHVAANRSPARRFARRLADGGDETIVNPARLDHERSSEICGQCHGVFVPLEVEPDEWDVNLRGHVFRPGDRLEDSRVMVRPAVLNALEHPLVQREIAGEHHYLQNRFWADGQIRIAGREYNGLIESPCFQRGELSCLSCHELHPERGDRRPLKTWADDQLRPEGRSNESCTQCHEELADAASLKAHSHHDPSGSGGSCQNCHMPYTTYGLLKALRSHEIAVPSVQESTEVGRPNACNLCHLDQTLAWTSERLADWYGAPRAELDAIGARVPAALVWSLKGDAAQRAIAAWHFGWEPALEASGRGWQAKALTQLLQDPYPAVRFIARRSLRRHPGFEGFEADVMSPGARLGDVARSARAGWEERRRAEGRGPRLDELFDDPEGLLPADLHEQLLAQRDDRFLYLAE